MSRTAPSPRTFRPRLEALEGRELPSVAGLVVLGVSQALQAQVNAANNDLSRLRTDANAEAAAAQFFGPSGSVQAIAPQVNGDLSDLQRDFNGLRTTNFIAGIVFSPAFLSAVLRRRDAFAIGPAVAAQQAVSNEVNSLPGQVSPLGDLILQSNASMSVNDGQQFFDFSTLILTT
jgi:hypothetical protein